MTCPKCNKKISLTEAIEEWEDICGDDAEVGEIFINWICPYCEKSIAGIFIEATADEEEIECPALKDKVIMPKFN